jgi:hypothetical protein
VAGFLLECVAGFVGIRNHQFPITIYNRRADAMLRREKWMRALIVKR